MAPAEDVDVEVWDGFTAMCAVVNHSTEAGFRESELFGDLSGGEEEVAEEGLVFGCGLANAGDGLARYDEEVCGSLRRNVREGTTKLVIVEDFSRDFPVVNFLK